MSDTLRMRWSKRRRDFQIDFPRSQDGGLVSSTFCDDRCRLRMHGDVVWDDSFVKQLEARGYDLTTLRFSIKRKQS